MANLLAENQLDRPSASLHSRHHQKHVLTNGYSSVVGTHRSVSETSRDDSKFSKKRHREDSSERRSKRTRRHEYRSHCTVSRQVLDDCKGNEATRAVAPACSQGQLSRASSPRSSADTILSLRSTSDSEQKWTHDGTCSRFLNARYKVLKYLGKGAFGLVLRCWDRNSRRYVALKMTKGSPSTRKSPMEEVSVLNELRSSSETRSSCVELLDWFHHKGNLCMVFEDLGPSLFDFLRRNRFRPFTMKDTQDILRQILRAVANLHDRKIIHTDLKPENILLSSGEYVCEVSSQGRRAFRRPRNTHIKLIDFGGAIHETDHHSSVISTRHFRAPEVILGLEWSYAVDVWSVGCIMVELYTGDALFQTHEDLEHLAMMERVLGPMPSHMGRDAGERAAKYFKSSGCLRWPQGASGKESVRYVRHMHKLKSMISKEHVEFRNLARKLLTFDPAKRISARDALDHPFFSIAYDD